MLFFVRIDCIGLCYSADLAVLQPNLYTTGMIGGRGEDIFDDAIGEPAAALVFFEDDGYLQSRVNVFSILAVHAYKGKRVRFPRDVEFYSVRILFTGFVIAALMAWKLTVSSVMAKAAAPARAKTYQERGVL